MEEGERAVNEIVETASHLVSEDRFQEAIKACNLPAEYGGIGLEERVTELRGELEERAEERMAELLSEFRAHLEANEFESAAQDLSTLRRFGLRESGVAVEQLQSELDIRRDTVKAEWAYEAKVEYFNILREADRLSSRRDYQGALEHIESYMKDIRYAALHSELQKEQESLRSAKSLFEGVLTYLRDNPGTEVRIKGVSSRVRSIEDGQIHVQAGDAQFTESVAGLDSKEIVRLARIIFAELPEAGRALEIAIFLLYDRRFPEARTQFKLASASAAAADLKTDYYVWRLELVADEKWDQARQHAVAERALHRMRAARKRGDWQETLKQVFELRQLTGEEVVSENRAEIDAVADEALQRIRGSAGAEN